MTTVERGARRPAYQPRPLPELKFPEALPVSARADEIAQAIRAHPVVIVCGETGSGKTTQLPKICALAGRGVAGLVGHTQPRRLAATSVARRIADELGSPLGTHVGYKIRFNEKLAAGATFKLMTDGILLAESQTDPTLSQYDTLIIDEAHERSLNIDFLLGYLKRLLDGPRRDSLRVIITSATIDGERFAQHFGSDGRPAPIIEVSGRLYPVDIRYRDPAGLRADGDDEEDETDLPSQIEAAIEELWTERPGDVLVFLPGEREIRDAAEHLRRSYSRTEIRVAGRRIPAAAGPIEILPLYSRLSAADQDRVFQSSNGRRIVLATNVAETSLTVPGIRYVVDSGLARVKRYRYRSRVEQLQIEPISQAAANQRSGRCGRVSDGVCVRLYSETDFTGRPRFTDPEVLRSSLAGVILRMRSLHLPDVEEFPFLDAPPRKAIVDGYALLRELNAVDEQRSLTDIGHSLARLPLDPRIGRMLLAARQQHSLNEVLVLAAALTSQDPRERPVAHQQAADQRHKRFSDEQSDFSSLLKLWNYWRSAQEGRSENGESNRQLAARLEREFLSVRKLREWTDVHSQLREATDAMRWQVNDTPATYEQIHCALLSGLLGSLGTKAPEDAQYTGTHAVKYTIHPSSSLARRSPRWLMAAEWIDTGRLYARVVARIEPQWIERVGAHLLSRSWTDPVWSKNAGQLVAMERGALYGLTIYAQRRVMRGAAEPLLSRERMILDGLVEGDLNADVRLPFIDQNRRLIDEVQKLEQKIRRPELLVNADFLQAWFESRVPAEVWSVELLARWWQKHKATEPRLLYLTKDELIRKDAEGVDSEAFPKSLLVKGIELELSYLFEPGSAQDGVTMNVPLHVLNQIDATALEWLVPGLLRDKVTALVKSLPQKLRRHLVPLPEFVASFCRQTELSHERPLIDALLRFIQARTSLQANGSDFKIEQVPAHLFMNLRLFDTHGRFVAESRSLAHLRSQFGTRAQSAFQSAFAQAGHTPGPLSLDSGASDAGSTAKRKSGHDQSLASDRDHRAAGQRFVGWDFGVLPEILEMSVGAGSTSLVGYPALIDREDAVELTVFDQPEEARAMHRRGLRRLFELALKEPIKYYLKSIPDVVSMGIAYDRFGSIDDLKRELVDGTLDRACMSEPWPVDREQFDARCVSARSRLNLVGQELARSAAAILSECQTVHKRLGGLKGSPEAQRDIESQLQSLLGKDFVTRTPLTQWPHLLRYLKSIVMRIDKIRTDPARDQLRMREMAALQQGYRKLLAQRAGEPDPRLTEFGWLLEELRVSLFAQELRTPMPVSVKRLEKSWSQLLALT